MPHSRGLMMRPDKGLAEGSAIRNHDALPTLLIPPIPVPATDIFIRVTGGVIGAALKTCI